MGFFDTGKGGGSVVPVSPLDAERELACKLKDAGARILVTTNIGFMAPLAQKLRADGLIDQLIVGDDTAFEPSPMPVTPMRAGAGLIAFDRLSADGANRLPRQYPKGDVEDV